MIPAVSCHQNIQTYKPQKQNQNISFGSTNMSYLYKNNKRMHCYTNFFRADLPWKDLGKIFHETFEKKPKVNIINGACSDGSESFSIVMALQEAFPRDMWNKFLPIKAFDFSHDLIINAKRGVVDVDEADIDKLNKLIPNYQKHFRPTFIDPAQQFYIEEQPLKKLQASNELLKNIHFEQNDVFKLLETLEDNGNTAFFFRNALIHLGDDAAKKFATLAGEKLKKGSLVIIGSTDVSTTNIKKYLNDNHFREIAKNIYKKFEPNKQGLRVKLNNEKKDSKSPNLFRKFGEKVNKLLNKIFIS